MSGFFNSSIGRKYAMALSAFFLIFFLIVHLSINFTSLFSAELFNELSHFMGTNPLIQFGLQPVLIIGIIFHFVMGFVLEIKNKKAVGTKYFKNSGASNSSWVSRNMLYSGLVILAFLVLHFIDFWIPEINIKYIHGDTTGMDAVGEFRYFKELQHKFSELWRVVFYVICFVLLGLHLAHGFTSAFQSVGVASGRKKNMKLFGKVYAIIIPLGFVIVAVYHFINH